MRFEIQSVNLSTNSIQIIGDVTPIFRAGVMFDVVESVTFSAVESLFTVLNDSTFASGITTVVVTENLTGTQLDPAIRPVINPLLIVAGLYLIDFTDPTKPSFIIHPYTTDNTSTSLLLPGRGVLNYGETLLEDLLHLLEHSANTPPPPNPTEGQIWFDSSQNMLHVFYGGSWKSMDAVFTGPAAPTSLTPGQLWFDTSMIQDRPQLMVYTGTEWVSVADFYVLKSGDTMTGDLTLTGNTSPMLTLESTALNSSAPVIRLYNADNEPSVGGTLGTAGYTLISARDGDVLTIQHSTNGNSGTRVFVVEQDVTTTGKFDAYVGFGDLHLPNGTFVTSDSAITKQFADDTYINVIGDEMTGALGIVPGTAAIPGLYVVGDSNTGLYSAGTDQLSITTGGVDRVRVFSSGRVSIGGTTDNGVDRLQVVGDVSAVNATLSGYLRGPASFVIDPATYNSNAGEVVINGNLVVQGTTTTIDSNTVNIGDSIITLNADETAVPSQNGGIEIERGTSTNTSMLWNETTDKWEIYDGTTTYAVIGSVTAGSGLTGGGQGPSITISHTDTSSVTDVVAATNTFIAGQTYDTFGHVLTRTMGTVDFSVSSNYAFSSAAISGDTGFTWGTVNTNTTQAAETSSDTLTFVNGTGINLYTSTVGGTDAIKIEHVDTSTVSDLSSASNTFITAQTYDGFGHVISRTTGTVDFTVASNYAFNTVAISTDTGFTWGTANVNVNQVADSSSDTITLVGGTGINLYTSTIGGTDAVKIEHADTSTQSSVTGLTGGSVFSGVSLDSVGHVTSLTTRTMTAADVGAPTATAFDTYARRYEVVGGTFGMPDAGVVIARFIAATNISIPVLDSNGSVAIAGVASSGTAVFDIQKNGVSFASLTFNASNIGVFDTGTTTLAPGDVLTVVAPAAQDITLSDIAFTIVGSLV